MAEFGTALDRADNDVLLHKLQSNFCLEGTAIDWRRSFLDKQITAGFTVILFVVPQGSVIGPTLFTL